MFKLALLLAGAGAAWMFLRRAKPDSYMPATDEAVLPYGDRDVADGSISGELTRMDRDANT